MEPFTITEMRKLRTLSSGLLLHPKLIETRLYAMVQRAGWTLQTGLVVFVLKERDQSYWQATIRSVAALSERKVLVTWTGKYEGLPDDALVDADAVFVATKLN